MMENPSHLLKKQINLGREIRRVACVAFSWVYPFLFVVKS